MKSFIRRKLIAGDLMPRPVIAIEKTIEVFLRDENSLIEIGEAVYGKHLRADVGSRISEVRNQKAEVKSFKRLLQITDERFYSVDGFISGNVTFCVCALQSVVLMEKKN